MLPIAVTVRHFFWKPSRLVWLVMAIFGILLIAVLATPARWASDGSIRLPVRVFVFDSEQGTPIAGAYATIFRCLFVNDPGSLGDSFDRFQTGRIADLPLEYWGSTDEKAR